jgi:hypothetical protein
MINVTESANAARRKTGRRPMVSESVAMQGEKKNDDKE